VNYLSHNCKKNLVYDKSVKVRPIKQHRSFCFVTKTCALCLLCTVTFTSEDIVLAVITSVTTRRTHWYNPLQLCRHYTASICILHSKPYGSHAAVNSRPMFSIRHQQQRRRFIELFRLLRRISSWTH